MHRFLVSTLAVALFAGCDAVSLSNGPYADDDTGNDDTGNSDTGHGDTNSGPDPTVEWEPCPLDVDQPSGVQAECAIIDVPLRWSEPDGPTLGIFVQRLAAPSQPARGQLWLLEGGPGGSGAAFGGFMEEFGAFDPTLDLYAVDHRGVGRSARLSCPNEEAETSDWSISVSPAEATSCLAEIGSVWGDDLDEFTTTAAARDLGRLIEVAAEPGKDVFVYGVSYGTYWAQRYLQIHPDQATAVILDSIAPPGVRFVEYDANMDAVAQDFFALCTADALCVSKFGGDPWAAVGDLLAAIESGGHCPAITAAWGIDVPAVRTILAVLLMSPITRTFLPPFVYRLARCDDADAVALGNLLDVLFGPSESTDHDRLASDALFYNVALSELWPDSEAQPAIDDISAKEDELRVSTGLSLRVAAVQDIWAAYPDDTYVDEWAATATPLLMMNGDLDPLTPIWFGGEAAGHFKGTSQWFYAVPRAAHCVVKQTPVAAQGDTSCGFRIMLSFLADPTVEPDTSCLAEIPEEGFVGDPAISDYLLGTVDLWENDAAASPVRSGPPAALVRALEEIGRLVPLSEQTGVSRNRVQVDHQLTLKPPAK